VHPLFLSSPRRRLGPPQVYIQSVISYLAPPIAVVYVAAIGYPPATTTGALASLAVGFALGVARFTASALYPAAALPFRPPPGGALGRALVHSNFLHFAAASTAASTAVLVSVSRCTAGPTPAQLAAVAGGLGGADAAAGGAVVDAARRRPAAGGAYVAADTVDAAAAGASGADDHDAGAWEVGSASPPADAGGSTAAGGVPPPPAFARNGGDGAAEDVKGGTARTLAVDVAVSAQMGLLASLFWHFR